MPEGYEGLGGGEAPEPVFQEDQGFSVIFRKDVFDRDSLVRAGLSERQISAVLFTKETGKITNAD